MPVNHPSVVIMDFTNDTNLFGTNSERFFISPEYIQNECEENHWKETYQPNQVASMETDWINKSMTDKNTVIFNKPDLFGDISTKVEIDESDFMQIAIDEIKLEWPHELKLSTFQETTSSCKISPWVPEILRPESPLPTLSDITVSGIFANLPPLSPCQEEEKPEYFLPENQKVKYSPLVKLENPLPVHIQANRSVNTQWPLGLKFVKQSLLFNDISSMDDIVLSLPSAEFSAEETTDSTSRRISGENDGVKERDALSDFSWQDCSDDEFGKRFEREEQMEGILAVYHKGGINADDNYIYCDLCNRRWRHGCPQHNKLKHVKDRQVPMGTVERARKTAPSLLSILTSKIKGANKGVWTTKTISRRTYFGPYEGCVVPVGHPNGEYCWKIMKDGKADFLVDGSNPTESNWMRYVNCARTADEQNLEAFQYRGKIYYRATKDIRTNQELLVWYGFKYAQKLGIKWTDFLESRPNNKGVIFSCDRCFHAYTNPILLEKHQNRNRCRQRPLAEDSSKSMIMTKVMKNGVVLPPPISSKDSSICMEVTTGDKPITCGACGARFHRRGMALKNHMKGHGDNHYCCLRCGQWFPDEVSRNKHQVAVLINRKHKTVRTKDVFCDTHINKDQMHSKRSKITFTNLPKHTKVFRGKHKYSTRQKGERSCTPLEQTSEPKATVSCQLKEKSVSNRRTAKKLLLCEKCGALFLRISLLLTHLERKHNVQSKDKENFARRCAARRFKCMECGVLYRERATLQRHEEERTTESEEGGDDGEEKLFSCKQCAMKFRAASTLKYHMETHNEKEKICTNRGHKGKKYKCKECNVRFKARSTFDLHIKTHQTKNRSDVVISTESPNKCSSSDKSKRKRSKEDVRDSVCMKEKEKSLLETVTVRSNEEGAQDQRKGLSYVHLEEENSSLKDKQPFSKCEDQLKPLLKRDHADEIDCVLQKKTRRIKSMECLACGFIFKDRMTLDVHVRKHTEEKMLLCDLSSVRV